MEEDWRIAVEHCRTGHPAGCTYGGGLSLAEGYWLAVDGCELGHGETCQLCHRAPTALKFADWGENEQWIWCVHARKSCAAPHLDTSGMWEQAR